MALLGRLIRAMVCAWLVVGLETTLVLALGHRMVTSVWEVQTGLLGFLPVLVLIPALLGVLGSLLLAMATAEGRERLRLGFALATGTLGALWAYALGGGRHLATLAAQLAFALGVGLVMAVGAYLVGPRLARWRRVAPRASALGVGCVILGLELVNRFWLVRLYPGMHLGLAFATLLLAPGLAWAWPAPAVHRPWAAPLLGVVLVLAGGALLPGARRFAHFDNLRLLFLREGPLLGQHVSLLARLAPPPPIKDRCADSSADVDCVEPTQSTITSTFSMRGRDLLLVTLDATRADHVGAYGYGRRTSPNLDELARTGVRFNWAYAATGHTSYSVTSLMTGKYMRPLLLLGAGEDSETWATLLRRYDYRTAAFYPPAVFFIDSNRFETFRSRHLGFEYFKVEFAEGERRVAQVAEYLGRLPADRRLFLWVHLFAPHEPYEKHRDFDFGDRDVDRYDSEIAFSDRTLGQLVTLFRRQRPEGVVIVSSDHGEEFGEHGGRYHGTTVYEEQLRVPMVIQAPGLLKPRVVEETVQTIDLLPTVLSALDIPRPPRLRGRDLGALLTGARPSGKGLALAETEEWLLLAEGPHRLVCARRVGACEMFDLSKDPRQIRDRASEEPGLFAELRARQRELSASHGRHEAQGLRAEGRGWPAPILRGITGDVDAAGEIAALLDDADPAIRRKAAELLFELRQESTTDALILALGRDEDQTVRAYCALALTRMDKGAPLVMDLLRDEALNWRRLAALALAEIGDDRGEGILVEWWRNRGSMGFERARQVLAALARIRAKSALPFLFAALDDVRLRPFIATSLARIDDPAAVGPLLMAFQEERYQSSRSALLKAMVELGAKEELARPLVRFLGVPDPVAGGLGFAQAAGILQHVGGPTARELQRLGRDRADAKNLRLVIPTGGNGQGLRVLVRAANTGAAPAEIRIGEPVQRLGNTSSNMHQDSNIKRDFAGPYCSMEVSPGGQVVEAWATAPAGLSWRPGRSVDVHLVTTSGVRLEALAIVPLADEIPPPAAQPWKAEQVPRFPPPTTTATTEQ